MDRLVAKESGRLAVPKYLEWGDAEWELHAGDGIEILVAGRWVPARVEWDDARREWYAVVPQGPGPEAPSLTVRLRAGLFARLPRRS